jgi:hypothetical protein
MMTPRSTDAILKEMNDLAKAQGRHLGKAFWEVPPQPGSILDVPETPESGERIARLCARRLAREQAAGRKSEPASGTTADDLARHAAVPEAPGTVTIQECP